MAIEIDPSRGITTAAGAAQVHCPNCHAQTRLCAIACPSFAEVKRRRPDHVGVAGMCAACGEPVFLRYSIRRLSERSIEFHDVAEPVERPREKFQVAYLPKAVAAAFNDALACYSHGLTGAFAAMCRLTARAVFADLGENGKLRVYDHVSEVRGLAEIDDADFAVVRHVIFDSDADGPAVAPSLDRTQAAVLLETMKDLLMQAYVRGARLRKALQMRTYFAEPRPVGNSTADEDSLQLSNA